MMPPSGLIDDASDQEFRTCSISHQTSNWAQISVDRQLTIELFNILYT